MRTILHLNRTEPSQKPGFKFRAPYWQYSPYDGDWTNGMYHFNAKHEARTWARARGYEIVEESDESGFDTYPPVGDLAE
jgi:hypothetical protein